MKKKLYFVSTPDLKFPDERFYAYVYSFGECSALNKFIQNLHKEQGIPLERIDVTHREVYEVVRFIK